MKSWNPEGRWNWAVLGDYGKCHFLHGGGAGAWAGWPGEFRSCWARKAMTSPERTRLLGQTGDLGGGKGPGLEVVSYVGSVPKG